MSRYDSNYDDENEDEEDSTADRFVNAISYGDLDGMREIIGEAPEVLDENLYHCRRGYGFALHTAAYYNQPAVIKFLVQQKGADVNQSADEAAYTPLHYAVNQNAFQAAAALLQLGADPAVKNGSGQDAIAFCQSESVQRLVDPHYDEKQKQKKIAGTWNLITPQEVIHEYDLPDNHCHLIDTFNFKAGFWRTVTQDTEHNSMSQSIFWFADMPGKAMLYEALEKLRELHGDADEAVIEGRTVILNKNSLTK